MAERLSALAAVYRSGNFGTLDSTGPGIMIAERRPLAMVQVAGRSDESAALRAGIEAALGVAPDTAANRTAARGTTAILWVGPRRWLVVASERDGSDLEARLRAGLAGTQAAITDLGNGRMVLRITGPRARDLLAKGSSIDFHGRAFPAGSCAQGLLGHVGALIHAVDAAPTFDLYVARSYAQTAWEWLTESAAEYGYRVNTTRE
jgi:heterotetrameric sarcosine oxidase gamma subunit